MAKKYIDASKLKAEIKRRHDYENEMYHKTKPDGRPNDGWSESLAIMGVLEELLAFLDSLQQEQPDVDLDADIEMEWDSFSKHLAKYGEESEDVVWLNWYNFNELARHFYEL